MAVKSDYTRIKKVLIVDDNEAVRQSIKLYLEMLGLESEGAPNAKEATVILKKKPIDLLITDFRMSEMDGVELLNWCRTNLIHIPVIFLSANADLLEKEQIALADCCATLMFKPINLDIFTAAIGAADSRNHHKDCVHFRKSAVK